MMTSAPAYQGCFIPPKDTNKTIVMKNDVNMKIARCLDFCRDQRFDFGGLFEGKSCQCLEDVDDLEELLPILCLKDHCVGDPIHACGGKDAVAVYDS